MARTMTGTGMHVNRMVSERAHGALAAQLNHVVIAAVLSVVLATQAVAQADLLPLEDASIVPRGAFRLRAATMWSRFDSRFTSAGEEPLGARLTSPALGRAQIGTLGSIDSLVSSAIAQPFTLSLGQSRLDARGRHEIVPIGFEYGLTNRISVGVLVPVVRKRVAVQFRLDSTGANVGPNLHRSLSSALTTNTLVQDQFANAAAQLQARLTSCQANPGGAGCPALLARSTEAQQLIAASQLFASSVGSLYGTATTNGLAFVPTVQSTAHTEIGLRVSAFNAQYRDLLASGSDLITAVPFGAPGPAGTADLQEYLTDELGQDSVATSERSGVGDIELGLRMLLWNRAPTPTSRLAGRATGYAGYRFGSSSQLSSSSVMDLRLGDGRDMVDARVALDLQAGRIGVLSAAEATVAFGGDASTSRDGRWTALHVAPRFHLATPFAIHGAYSMRSGDVTGAEQLVGGGVSFMTPGGYGAEGSIPLEMRFTHLQSLSGPAGAPKQNRDLLEMRLYFDLFGRR